MEKEMSGIVIVQKGSYKFEAKQCENCKKFKKLNKFRYIKYFNTYRRICMHCEKKKREKVKREKIKFKKKHGVPERIYKDAETRTSIKVDDTARNIIFSKTSNEEKKKFNLSNNISKVVDGINAILFFVFILFIFTPLNGLLDEFPYIKTIGFTTIFLVTINKIKKLYRTKYWDPINKKILDQKELLYPKTFKHILKDVREEFQKDENFYSSLEWREVRKQVLKSQKHICYMCKVPILLPFDLTVDHVKPKSKYPSLALELSNLKIACRSCNSKKGVGSKDKFLEN